MTRMTAKQSYRGGYSTNFFEAYMADFPHKQLTCLIFIEENNVVNLWMGRA